MQLTQAAKGQSVVERYSDNRCKFPLEKLAEYGGQWVAWGSDGTHIVAHHGQLLTLLEMVKAAGIDTANVVLSSIPPRDEVQLL